MTLRRRFTTDFKAGVTPEAPARYGRPKIISTDQGRQLTSFEFTNVRKEAVVAICMDGRVLAADAGFETCLRNDTAGRKRYHAKRIARPR